MLTKETVIDTQNIYDGKILSVKKFTVLLSNGEKSLREEVEHTGGSCVLAVKDGFLYLVSQYRLSVKRDTLELPAGKKNEGEDPEITAIRELKEETGLVAKKLTKISSILPTPGYSNEVIHVYFCDEFENGENSLDEGEFLNVHKIKVKDAFSLLDSGKIQDAKTVIALLYYRNKIEK